VPLFYRYHRTSCYTTAGKKKDSKLNKAIKKLVADRAEESGVQKERETDMMRQLAAFKDRENKRIASERDALSNAHLHDRERLLAQSTTSTVRCSSVCSNRPNRTPSDHHHEGLLPQSIATMVWYGVLASLAVNPL
jgi:hypothetical protein